MKSYKRSALQAVRCTALLAGLGLAVGFSPPAQAALQAVGPNATFSNGAATGFTFPAWYQDQAGLRLDLCALMNDPFCFAEGAPPANEFPSEAFWWAAEALIPGDPAVGEVNGLLVLALEAAFTAVTNPNELIVPEQAVAFARIRIRVDVPTPGTYTVTHPFGSQTYVIPDNLDGTDANGNPVFDGTRAINETQDIGDFVTGGPTSNFAAALADGPGGEPGFPPGNISTSNASIGPFLQASATPGGAPLPFVTSITPGAKFLANPLVPTNITGAVAGGTNFFSITNVTTGVTQTQNLFSLTGLVSGTQPAKVTLDEADYRVRTGKWALFGTSTNPEQVTTGPGAGVTTHFTNLFGAQEMPPQTSAASGSFSAVFDSAVPASFDYSLTLNVPAGTDMTQAHIHTGAVGVNGPVIFFLCSDGTPAPPAGTPLCAEVNGVVTATGTLTANELQGGGTFTAATDAIKAGATYVNAHSVAVPTGEIRGQIGRNVISLRAGVDGPAIGAAAVGDTGLWQFNRKGIVAPKAEIEAETSDGITATRALRLR